MENDRLNPDPQEAADNAAWRREMAREAGMLHGVAAFNDAMGQSLGNPDDHGQHCDEWCICNEGG